MDKEEILKQLEIDYNNSNNLKIEEDCKGLFRVINGKRYESELKKFVLSPKTDFEKFKEDLYEFIEEHK